jgi:hypothetical protein
MHQVKDIHFKHGELNYHCVDSSGNKTVFTDDEIRPATRAQINLIWVDEADQM